MTRLERQLRSHGQLVIWLSVLIPPIVWAVQMEINYVLLRRACANERNIAMHLTMLAALAITIIAAVLAWASSWPLDRASGSTRFAGILGFLSSALFFAAILAQGLATLMFHPCQL